MDSLTTGHEHGPPRPPGRGPSVEVKDGVILDGPAVLEPAIYLGRSCFSNESWTARLDLYSSVSANTCER